MNDLWLSVGVVGLAVAVAGGLSFAGGKYRFKDYLFHGLSLACALVVIASFFSAPLWEMIRGQNIFLIVLSLSAILSAIQNVGHMLNSRKADELNPKGKV